jgi:hypothetical protein
MNLAQAAHRRREGLADSVRRHQSRAVKAMASNAVRSLVIATAMCLLPDWSSAQQPRANAQPLFTGKNVLIVVARENETGSLPPLKTKIDRIEQYDVVFLGFPTWGMQLPPPIKSFLRQQNLRRKTVIPFNTNAGHGVGSTFQTVRDLCV